MSCDINKMYERMVKAYNDINTKLEASLSKLPPKARNATVLGMLKAGTPGNVLVDVFAGNYDGKSTETGKKALVKLLKMAKADAELKNIIVGTAVEGSINVNRVGYEKTDEFTTNDGTTIKLTMVENFGNPFMVLKDTYYDPSSVGYYTTTINGEASKQYEEWLRIGERPKPINKEGDVDDSIDVTKSENNLKKRRLFILNNLKHLKDRKLYYFGTARNNLKKSHAYALLNLSKDDEFLDKIPSIVEELEKDIKSDTDPNRPTPEFDKLPSWDPNVKTMAYAGIGSRETPLEVMQLMNKASKWLEGKGYTLRSGQAVGADMAFEGEKRHITKPKNGEKIGRFSAVQYPVNRKKDGSWDYSSGKGIKLHQVKNKEIYVTTDIINDMKSHPASKNIPNAYVEIGDDVIRVTERIAKETHPYGNNLKGFALGMHARNTHQIFGKYLDTPADFVLYYTPENKSSGTDQALRLAEGKGIPTINMADKDWRKQLKEVLSRKASNKEQPKQQVKGININKYQNGLGYKLTNPTYDKNKGLYVITPSFDLENKPYGIANVEGWYKANNAKVIGIKEGAEGDKHDVDLMTKLITDKLKQYPELVTEIDANGGIEFLEKSTHNIHTKNVDKASRWETVGRGKNLFIKALTEAYKVVKQPKQDTTKQEKPQDEGTIETIEFFDSTVLKNNPNKIYVFDDNTDNRTLKNSVKKYGSTPEGEVFVPKSTQAIIRGLPNAFGVDTRKSMVEDFVEADLDKYSRYIDKVVAELQKMKDSGKTIVLPKNGIGTDKAKLPNALFNALAHKMNEFAGFTWLAPKQDESTVIETTDLPLLKYNKNTTKFIQNSVDLYNEFRNKPAKAVKAKYDSLVSRYKHLKETASSKVDRDSMTYVESDISHIVRIMKARDIEYEPYYVIAKDKEREINQRIYSIEEMLATQKEYMTTKAVKEAEEELKKLKDELVIITGVTDTEKTDTSVPEENAGSKPVDVITVDTDSPFYVPTTEELGIVGDPKKQSKDKHAKKLNSESTLMDLGFTLNVLLDDTKYIPTKEADSDVWNDIWSGKYTEDDIIRMIESGKYNGEKMYDSKINEALDIIQKNADNCD